MPNTLFFIVRTSLQQPKQVRSGEQYRARNARKAKQPFSILADKYDVDAKQSVERANERIRKSVEDAFGATVKGYATVMKESGSVRLHGGKVKYALFPVWLLTTTWNGQNYLFAMNGQSGKMVGNLPLEKGSRLSLLQSHSRYNHKNHWKR